MCTASALSRGRAAGEEDARFAVEVPFCIDAITKERTIDVWVPQPDALKQKQILVAANRGGGQGVGEDRSLFATQSQGRNRDHAVSEWAVI